jgi:hypothetical protein
MSDERDDDNTITLEEARRRRDAEKAAKKTNGHAQRGKVALVMLHDVVVVGSQDRLVNGVLGDSGLAMLYGETSSGKSFATFDACMHIALGWEWFGRKVTPSAVLYVAAEAPGSWGNRVEAFCRHHQLDQDQRERLPFGFILSTVNLGPQGHDSSAIIAAAKDLEDRSGEKCRLIAIDTMARATPGHDENDPVDVSKFVAKIDAIRNGANATPLVVHHSGKNLAAGARGHSSLRAAMDYELEVERNGEARTLRVRKNRDGSDGGEFGFQLQSIDIGTDEDGQPITSCVVVPGDVVKKRRKRTLAQQAADALSNALVDFGETPPIGGRWPSGQVLRLNRFREALKAAGITEAENDVTERQQWSRIRRELMASGILIVQGEFCWRL